MSHSHDYGAEVRVSSLSRSILFGFLTTVAVAVGFGMFHYWPDRAEVTKVTDSAQFAAPGVDFPTGEISAITETCGTLPDDVGRPPCWTLEVTLTSGPEKGRTVAVQVQGPVLDSGLTVGDRVQLTHNPANEGFATPGLDADYTFFGVDRRIPLGWLALGFVLIVAVVARLRGLLAIAGLGIAGAVLVWFMLPGLLSGENGIAVAAVGSGAIMYGVLYLAHGPSLRTSTALAGTLAGAALTGVLAYYAVDLSRLSGIVDEQSALLSSYAPNLDFRALLMGAIMIAGLGVLNDVTITQASAVWELRAAGPTLNRRQLFTSGMRIGRDHIASTIYTIVFAYAGAALSVLMLLYAYDRPLLDLLSTEDLATEVARTLCSAIGLVLAVPMTTAIAAVIVAGPESAVDTTEDDEPLLPRHRL